MERRPLHRLLRDARRAGRASPACAAVERSSSRSWPRRAPSSSRRPGSSSAWQSRPWHGPIVTVVYRLDELDRVEALLDRVLRSFVVWSSQKQTKHLSPWWPRTAAGRRARRRRRRRRRPPRRPGGKVGRHEDAPRAVVAHPCACLREQLVVRLRAPDMTTRSQGVTRPLTATDSTRAATAAGLDVRGLRLAEVEDADDVDPAASRSAAAARPRSSAVTTNARSAGLTDHRLTRRRDAVGQHHADEVVAREDERLLGDTGRDDDLLGADLDQRVAVGHRARSRTRRARSRWPARGARRRRRAPASRSSAARALPARSARSEPPTAGPSSTRTRGCRRDAAATPPRAPPGRRRSRGRRRARGRPRRARSARRRGRASRARPARGGPSRRAARASAAG